MIRRYKLNRIDHCFIDNYAGKTHVTDNEGILTIDDQYQEEKDFIFRLMAKKDILGLEIEMLNEEIKNIEEKE